jgi:tetratricopeptide (TPR) repeat protein
MIEGRFSRLLDEAQERFASGDLRGARERFDAAEALARAAGADDLADRAFCNACFVGIESGQAEREIPRLQRLFMGSSHLRNRCSAAYNLAAAYINLGDLDKAYQWASRSGELAEQVDDPGVRAGSNNQAATLALRLSHYDQAEAGFRRALTALEGQTEAYQRANRAAVTGNLGYVMMCTDRVPEGLGLCEQARGALEEAGADHLVYENLQDLCYGYILDDRLEQAQACGERALELAEEYEDLQVMKNCLFLLAEIAVRKGDTFRARRFLRELTHFYPEIEMNEEIIEVFLATDLTNVVNLRG